MAHMALIGMGGRRRGRKSQAAAAQGRSVGSRRQRGDPSPGRDKCYQPVRGSTKGFARFCQGARNRHVLSKVPPFESLEHTRLPKGERASVTLNAV